MDFSGSLLVDGCVVPAVEIMNCIKVKAISVEVICGI